MASALISAAGWTFDQTTHQMVDQNGNLLGQWLMADRYFWHVVYDFSCHAQCTILSHCALTYHFQKINTHTNTF